MKLLHVLFPILVFVTVQQVCAEGNDSPVSLGADLRYRHELIDVEGKDARNRHRIRARVNMTANVQDNLSLGFQLGSGSDDPISTNQTLTGGFTSKQVNIDLAYFTWKPATVSGLSLSGGKVKNPFRIPAKTELLWDNDLNPEGLALRYSRSGGAVPFFVTASYFWVEERKTEADAVLLGTQAGVDLTTAAAKIIAGAGYFDYQNTRRFAPFYDSGDSFGNSVDENGMYRYDYNDLEFFFEATPQALPGSVTVFAEYVSNIAGDVNDNTGWMAGFSAGKCKNPGSFDASYYYKYLERDAVVGAFTASDFSDGGADGKGHVVNLNYQLASKTVLSATYYYNQLSVDNGKNYHRLQLDMNFKL